MCVDKYEHYYSTWTVITFTTFHKNSLPVWKLQTQGECHHLLIYVNRCLVLLELIHYLFKKIRFHFVDILLMFMIVSKLSLCDCFLYHAVVPDWIPVYVCLLPMNKFWTIWLISVKVVHTLGSLKFVRLRWWHKCTSAVIRLWSSV